MELTRHTPATHVNPVLHLNKISMKHTVYGMADVLRIVACISTDPSNACEAVLASKHIMDIVSAVLIY